MPDSEPVDPAVEAAQTAADTAWQARDVVRDPMRDDLLVIFGQLEGTTGLAPGPGAQRLVDVVLDYSEQHAEQLAETNTQRLAALAAQQTRDDTLAAHAPPAPPPETSVLLDMDDYVARAWLRGANDADVTKALNELTDPDVRVAWAKKMLDWARADGNIAQVFVALNETIKPGSTAPATPPPNVQDPETASASDEPVTDDQPEPEPAPDAPAPDAPASDAPVVVDDTPTP